MEYKKIISQATNQSRKNVAKKLNLENLHSLDRMCFMIGPELAEILERAGIRVERIGYALGSIRHEFMKLRVPNSRQFYLLDHSYLQFVDPKLRIGLPSVIFVPIQSAQQIARTLSNHRIPKKYHIIWLSKLF